MSGLFNELKRRSVFRVGAAYAVVGWLLIQVGDVAADNLSFPDWFMPMLFVVIGLGFPVALLFSWAFEMTPEGVKKTAEVDADASITPSTGQKLNYTIIAALVLALGFIAWDKLGFDPATVPIVEADAIKTIAVLPFVDLSPGGDQGYFADGLTEEILNSLARLPELKVTARTSAFYFKDRNIPIPEIAATLGVAHVVEGSVRRAGNQLRITAQLIRAEDGFHLWSDTYDRTVDDIFAVQEDVAENIARAMDVVLDDEKRAAMFTLGTRNVEAYEAFLRGVATSADVHGGAPDLSLWRAHDYFSRAIDIDPNFANAYYFRVDSYVHFLKEGAGAPFLNDQHPSEMTPELAYQLLHQDLDLAIELSESSIDRIVYEIEKITFSNDWRRMQAVVAQLKQFDGFVDSLTGGWTIETLMVIGEAELALEISRAGLERSPLDADLWTKQGSALFVLGRSEAAIESLHEARRRGVVHDWLDEVEYAILVAMAEKQRLQDAFAHLRMTPNSRLLQNAVSGEREQALAMIEALDQSGINDPMTIWAYALLGDQAKADELARQADHRLLGSAHLADLLLYMGGKLPFTLENSPEFAKRLSEAGLSAAQLSAIEPSDDAGIGE